MLLQEMVMKGIEEIVRAPGVAISDLQTKLNINAAQIETILRNSNTVLKENGYPNIIRRGKKLWVELGLDDFETLKQHIRTDNKYILNPQLRLALISVIIFTREKTSLNSLADELMVSKNTIANDIKGIRRLLTRDDVSLEYSRAKGYYFNGGETSIRFILIQKLYTMINYGQSEKLLETFTPISSQDISDSKNKIKILEQNLNTQFSAFQITLMGLLMPLILLRIQEMNTISSNEYRDILQIISKDDYQRIRIAMKKTHVFEAVPETEKAFLIIQILSANVIKSSDSREAQLSDIVDLVIDRFERRAVVYFEEREKLKRMLYQHIGPAVYRIKYGIPYEDHNIESIIREYQDILPLAKDALRPLENFYHVEFSDAEVVYVGLIFQSFLTKSTIQRQEERITAIVVCENGVSVSNLLFEVLAQMFPMIEFVTNLSAREFYANPLVYKNIKVVFSTIHLKTNKTVFIVPPLLTTEDRQRLIRSVNKKLFSQEQGIEIADILNIVKQEVDLPNEDRLRQRLNQYFNKQTEAPEGHILGSKFNQLLPERRIRASRRALTFVEAIQYVAEPLLREGIIEQRYVDSILKNYDPKFPYFVIAPGIAIPHASFRDGVNELGLSLLKLYQPISFSRELQVQVLLMIAPVDNLQHRRAVQAFYDCVIKPANRNELFKLQTSKEIKAFFLKKIG